MKNIFIYTEGVCWKRLLDANKILTYLKKNGYNVVEKIEDADAIILLTCAFLNDKSKKSIDSVKKFQKYDAELIVAGCLPAVEKEKLSKVFKGRTIETRNLERDIELVFPPEKMRFNEVEDANFLFEPPEKDTFVVVMIDLLKKSKLIEKTFTKIKDHILRGILGENSVLYKFSKKQFHIRIAWGCTGNCSYCTIKESTGPFHSKPFNQCIKEFKRGVEKGYKNFVLDATDIGAYGIDIGSSFPELLDHMTRIPGDYYITIREINAKWVVKYAKELEEILRRNKILIFDVAIQSGSSRILKLMNRPSNIEETKDALIKIREGDNVFSLTCEFIIGFPTETWDEFLETLYFIRDVNFDGGQLYKFSSRSGTKAERIEPKISEEEVIRRLKYSKKFLKNNGYYAKYLPREQILIFMKKT